MSVAYAPESRPPRGDGELVYKYSSNGFAASEVTCSFRPGSWTRRDPLGHLGL